MVLCQCRGIVDVLDIGGVLGIGGVLDIVDISGII